MLLENEKINYNPLVLVNRILMPIKHKTDIKGYWLDNNKIYIDNIIVKSFFAIHTSEFYNQIKILFSQGELAIFYKNIHNEGIIIDKQGKKTILKNRIAYIENKKPSKKYIKALLIQHNGLTIYKLKDNKYLIEIYK